MSNESIAPTQKNSNDWNFINRSDRTFAAMIPDLTLSEIDNPRRFVSHPSGWRFVVEHSCFGPIVLGAAPHHKLSAASCLVDGPAARRVMVLLALRPRWLYTSDGTGLHYVRLADTGQVVAVCNYHLREHQHEFIRTRPSPGHSRNGDLAKCHFCDIGVGTRN